MGDAATATRKRHPAEVAHRDVPGSEPGASGHMPCTALDDVTSARRMPIGAECVRDGGVSFRVWAPKRAGVEIVLEGGPGEGTRQACQPEPGGYFRATVPAARAGTIYRFRLDGAGDVPRSGLALPARRAARPVAGRRSATLRLDRPRLARRRIDGAGHLRDARRHLHARRDLGRGEAAAARAGRARHHDRRGDAGRRLPRRFGWGYDGVNLFAPTRLYGTPDDFRRFVDRAHALGLGVILDVVYNHLGPDGNYLAQFSDRLLHRPPRERLGRGDQLRRPGLGPGARVLRRQRRATGSTSSTSTACASTRRRASSTPRRTTSSPRSAARVRGGRARPRRPSSSPRTSRRTRGWSGRRSAGGYGLDALWNDDFHHSAVVALTGHARGLLHRLPRHAAGAALGGASTASSTRGSATPGSRQRRGTPALDLRAGALRHLPREPRPGRELRGAALRVHALTQPGPPARADGAAAARPRDADAVPGAGVRRLGPFLYFADHDARARARASARGAGRSSPSSRRSRRRRWSAAPARPRRTPATFERCKLDLARARAGTAPRTRCTATSSRSAAATRVLRRGAGRRRRRRARAPRRFVLRFFGPEAATTGCCSSTSAPTRRSRRRRSRCSPRPPGRRWALALVERGPALRRRRDGGRRSATSGLASARRGGRRPSVARRRRPS